MRHIHGGLGRAAVVVALTISLTAGCGGDDTPDETSSASADLEAMHEAVHEVGDLIDEASNGASDYQAVVNGVRDQDPSALLTDQQIATALAEQQEREQARNDAIDALADEPAMDDPDVAAAYEEFQTAATEMFAFQDGYNAAMPQFLRSFDLCGKIFDINVKLDALSVVPGVYAQDWIDEHMLAAEPCREQLVPLSESTNVNIQDYVTSVRTVINKRNQAMEAQGFGRISLGQAYARIKRANEAFTHHLGEITDFSAELEKISAIDEYQALDAVLEEKVGSGSPSPSSS